MRLGVGRSIAILAFVCASASTVAAQGTRNEWLAQRTAKQARHHRLTVAATRANTLTVTTVRFFSDSAGNLVGVGEVRNHSSFNLSYSRLNFRFFDASGEDLGGEWTYVFGGRHARILNSKAYETVLPPGGSGFFKLWTEIPATAMASHTVNSAGEELAFARPVAATGNPTSSGEPWLPMVFLGSSSLSGRRFSGTVLNDDPLTPNCPCGWPSIYTHSIRVTVAAYQDNVITDVQSMPVPGPRTATVCGQPVSGIFLHDSASVTIDLARPANRIGSAVVEWEETGPDMLFGGSHVFPVEGGSQTVNVVTRCGPATLTTSESWVAATVDSSGNVVVTVRENPTFEVRHGSVTIDGRQVSITQDARCEYHLSRDAVFFGSGTVLGGRLPEVSTTCSISPAISGGASWLQRVHFSVNLEPNRTGRTRSATFSVGGETLTVTQSAGGRNADFSSDGWMDLLWHHTGGATSTWLMTSTSLSDGRFLSPSHVADTGWKPVAVADFNRNGSPDIVWQHADGRLAYWNMRDTSQLQGIPLVPSQVTAEWRIRGTADFNQDGDADLVWQNETTGHVAVWLMQPQGLTPMRISGDPLGPGQVGDLNWALVGTGDFNLDGWPDLVWQHQSDGRIAVWTMRGTTLLEGDLISPGQVADLDWKIRAVGDINGDDWPDLIWQHRVTGDVSAWLMNETTMMAGVPLGRVADTNWHIVGPR